MPAAMQFIFTTFVDIKYKNAFLFAWRYITSSVGFYILSKKIYGLDRFALLMNSWNQCSSLFPTCFLFSPSTLSFPLQRLTGLSHFSSNSVVTHIHRHWNAHSVLWHTHYWTVCGNGRSVLRPCWGAADWSCTDLPPAPRGFVTHVCDAGLNTCSLSFCLCLSLSLSFCLSLVTVVLSLAMQCSGLMLLHLSTHLCQYSASNTAGSHHIFL